MISIMISLYHERCFEGPRRVRPLRTRPGSGFDLVRPPQIGSPAAASRSPADGSVRSPPPSGRLA